MTRSSRSTGPRGARRPTYAGLQHRSQGDWVSILSFWNAYYTDEQGISQTLQARLVYPEPDANGQSAWLGPNGDEPTYSGSYAYGAQGNRFWAITSGVGGDWYADGRGETGGWYSVE